MGIWVFPVALFLLCLTSESLQGGEGLPRLPLNLGKGYSPASGLGTAFGGDTKPQKSGSPTQNGYGTGTGGDFGGVVKPQKSGYGAGLGAGAFPGGGAQLGFNGRNGLGIRTSPKAGSLPGGGMKPQKPGPPAQNGHGPGTAEGMKSPKPGFVNGNGIGAGTFPGAGAQPGFGRVGKAQKPGLGDGNGQGAGTFPGIRSQSGLGGGLRPQKPGYEGVKPQKPGFRNGNGNGFGLGAQPGPLAQNGHGPGTAEGMKPPKPGFVNGNGIGAGTFPGAGAQPVQTQPQKAGLAAQNRMGAGFGEGRKPQKPGYGNGLDALPDVGVGGRLPKPAPAAQNDYGQGYGLDSKAQKPGLWNGHGLGVQLGYRNGLGPRAFQGQGPRPELGEARKLLKPGYLPGNRLGIPPGPGMGMKPPKTGYNNGNVMSAQPGPCNGGIAPAQLLPRPPTPLPSDKGGGWSLKSQLPPPVQNSKFPAPTPAIQWGLKPQKAGYQPFNGYGAGAELGFHGGLKLQKVGFHYGNGALEAGILPESQQSAFPIASGFRNGLREETLLYPKATGPTLERHGQAGASQPWGGRMKSEYEYAGLRIQAGPYGQLRPELRLEHLEDPEVKTYTNSQLGNGYKGHCPSGKC